MDFLRKSLAPIFSVACLILTCSDLSAQDRPVRIIFDTDMGNDVDDALALAMLHSLESRGESKLLAVTITKDHPLAAAYVDAVNKFYGRNDIPIGIVKDGPTKDEGKFNIVAQTTDAGALRYPHDYANGEPIPDAIPLLRKTLASQSDGSVTVVQVGFFTKLALLLETEPDEYSPLSGKELVANKVRSLQAMPGSFDQQ